MRSGNKNILGNLQAPKINQLIDNTLLNAFDIAVNGSLTRHGMVDGIRDAFVDESGIDTGTSTNETYNSSGDYYSPFSSPGGIDSNTKLMIHANGGDSSGQDHIPTYVATAKIDATTYKWEAGSLLLDGDSDYLTIPDSLDWDICGSNSDDWTIDLWIKHTDHTGAEYYFRHHEDGSNAWYLYHNDGAGLIFTLRSGGSNIITFTGGEITDTNWHHVALIKVADEYGIYIDGTQTAYTQSSSTDIFSGLLVIGGRTDASAYFDGNMDGIRIQHSNIFSASPNSTPDDTITVPTSVSTADANTKLLLSFEDGDQYAGHNVEPQGTVQVDRTTYKFGTGAWKFDGNSDYLQLPDSADWDIFGSNSDNWTLDFWIKFTDYTGTEYLFSQYEDSANFWALAHEGSGSSGFYFFCKSGGIEIINQTFMGNRITDTNWHHCALIKVADEYAFYLDGAQDSYLQDSSTDTFAGSLFIGVLGIPANYFDGYMDEVRIQNSNIFSATPNSGKTDTITVPTAEYTTIAEVFNMTLISVSTTASADPDNARLVLFEEDVDAITLNTDLKAWASKDGGSTWAQVTLADEGDYDTNQRILAGSVDLTASGIGSGTSIKYKVTTHNAKELKIHGVGELWD